MEDLQLGFYRHYKGQLYQLIGTAKHSETYEDMALYIPQYGDGGYWVRPLAMFQDSVTIEGVQIPRFEYLHPQPTLDPAPKLPKDPG
jgi:hypothetical protein